MTVKLTHSDLWIGNINNKKFLSSLSTRNPIDEHIHGNLNFIINSRPLPYMGFFGPEDVCFNTWLPELQQICKMIETDEHVFDEGEQGQPAYKFVRNHDEISISIMMSASGEGCNDPDWQNIKFKYQDFKIAYANFIKTLKKEIILFDVNSEWWTLVATQNT